MMQEPVIVATAIACAAMSGVFFAFSTFVMQGLRRLPPAQGIAAMQSINVAAVTPIFMTALFGTAAACAVVAVRVLIDWRGMTSSTALIAGSLSYLIGTIGVTVAFNVPLNNALTAADPSSGHAVGLWMKYMRAWTAWNHVRTVSGLIAAALLMLAVIGGGS
jgi:uncharacterized membrane protein